MCCGPSGHKESSERLNSINSEEDQPGHQVTTVVIVSAEAGAVCWSEQEIVPCVYRTMCTRGGNNFPSASLSFWLRPYNQTD